MEASQTLPQKQTTKGLSLVLVSTSPLASNGGGKREIRKPSPPTLKSQPPELHPISQSPLLSCRVVFNRGTLPSVKPCQEV